ncbi:hypothetical protein GCM10007368_26390 [Isoptericola cucumis]|uniref:Uncharacterized protein n=1 Tax=Isoptericola cucumis TaxID=1776856 RepID=A0ABQ2B9T8_9MICO|nr:hypothetical protein GCM10007368_26390 [Isoptericola cucumis]
MTDSIETSGWACVAAACIDCIRSPSAPEKRSQMRTVVPPPALALPAQPLTAPPSATAPAPTSAVCRNPRRDNRARASCGAGPVGPRPRRAVILDLPWCNVAL